MKCLLCKILSKMIKRLIYFLLLIAICICGCNEKGAVVNIWHVPHPDDEALFMGGSIYESYLDGNTNIIVLYSQGKNSCVKDKLEITTEKLGKLRIAEFRKSCNALCIESENIYIYDLEDGNFSIKEVHEIVLYFMDIYPNAYHHTMTYLDNHSDHATVGSVLYQLADNNNCKFYIANYDNNIVGNNIILSSESIRAKQNALNTYKIGQISVPNLFELQYFTPTEIFHY